MSKLREKIALLDKTAEPPSNLPQSPTNLTEFSQDVKAAIKYQIELVISARGFKDDPEDILNRVLTQYSNNNFATSFEGHLSAILSIIDDYYIKGIRYFVY